MISARSGGVTLAVTKKLIAQGKINRDEEVVICITGNGYKTLEAVQGTVESPFEIPARLADFDALYATLRDTRQASSPAGAAPQFTISRSRPIDISKESVPAWADRSAPLGRPPSPVVVPRPRGGARNHARCS